MKITAQMDENEYTCNRVEEVIKQLNQELI